MLWDCHSSGPLHSICFAATAAAAVDVLMSPMVFSAPRRPLPPCHRS